MLVDSHCHLDRLELDIFDGSLSKALDAARLNGVEEFLCISINSSNHQLVLEIADSYEDVYASIGIHPLYSKGEEIDVEKLVSTAKHSKVIAIGETGLDYYYDKESAKLQQDLFRTHVRASVESGLPLIVHTRDAQQDTLDILKEEGADKVGGVLHCFTESLQMAEKAMEMGFYISFSGIVTFKNAAELQEVAKVIPEDRILVETDSPYLTPVPYRGKPNSPRHVADVAKFVAGLRQVKYEDFCLKTTENYRRLFKR